MTKHKNVAEPTVDESVVQGPDGPIVIEKLTDTITVTRVAEKAFKFEVLAGIHMNGEVPVSRGEVVASDDDLVAIHGNKKFRRVE